MTTALQRALSDSDAALRAGDARGALGIAQAAQKRAPDSPHLAARIIEACLQSNTLLCAAHGTRTLLRFADADDADACRLLAAARAFGVRAGRLRWCPLGEPCEAVANGTVDETIAQGSAAGVDGGLWSGERLVSTLKRILADEGQWKGGGEDSKAVAAAAFNHAVMHHMQGNVEMAREMYQKAINVPRKPRPPLHAAHAHANLAELEGGVRGRLHLESALKLSPKAAEAAEWKLALAVLHWRSSSYSQARYTLRGALSLRNSSFGLALASELASLSHLHGKAIADGAKAMALQRLEEPMLPRCASWGALLPQLPALWGDPQRATPNEDGKAYRELLLSCAESHIKLSGGAWHEAERQQAPEGAKASLPLDDGSFDEVHWCVPPAAKSAWRESWRVLRPGGLLQVPDGARPPARMKFDPVDTGRPAARDGGAAALPSPEAEAGEGQDAEEEGEEGAAAECAASDEVEYVAFIRVEP